MCKALSAICIMFYLIIQTALGGYCMLLSPFYKWGHWGTEKLTLSHEVSSQHGRVEWNSGILTSEPWLAFKILLKLSFMFHAGLHQACVSSPSLVTFAGHPFAFVSVPAHSPVSTCLSAILLRSSAPPTGSVEGRLQPPGEAKCDFSIPLSLNL